MAVLSLCLKPVGQQKSGGAWEPLFRHLFYEKAAAFVSGKALYPMRGGAGLMEDLDLVFDLGICPGTCLCGA